MKSPTASAPLRGRRKGNGECSRRRLLDPQHTRLQRRTLGRRRSPAGPFPAVQNKTGCVNGLSPPLLCISLLPLREFLAGEPVRPAQTVPVIHVKRNRHEIPPQSWTLLQSSQPRLRRRATAASLGGKQLDQRNARGLAFAFKQRAVAGLNAQHDASQRGQ